MQEGQAEISLIRGRFRMRINLSVEWGPWSAVPAALLPLQAQRSFQGLLNDTKEMFHHDSKALAARSWNPEGNLS